MVIRLTEKKIEEVVKFACGADVIPLIRKLKGKENISEFRLAEQLKEDIKRVRNILYRLYGANLVEFIRKKDKKKGWYIYYWTFKQDQIRYLYRRIKEEQLDKLKDVSDETEKQFFMCVNKCVRMDFEQAVGFEYRCPECGELTQQESITEKLDEKYRQIKELECELKDLD